MRAGGWRRFGTRLKVMRRRATRRIHGRTFKLAGHAEGGPAGRLLTDGLDDVRVSVAGDQRTPGADIVDVFPPRGVTNTCSGAGRGEHGATSYRLKGAHGGVHTTGDEPARLIEQPLHFRLL